VRIHRATVPAAFLLAAAGSLTPIAAHATTTATTLYVNNSTTAHCSDSGTGTSTAPFCTIQAAAKAASAGTTVLVEPGTYTAATITVTGTEAAPITIKSAQTGQADVTSDNIVPSFTVKGSSYVTIQGFQVGTVSDQGALIDNSSHVTIDSARDYMGDTGYPQPVVEVTGTSSYFTLSRSLFQTNDGHSAMVQIDSGSAHDVITTNVFSSFAAGVVATDSPDSVITSNSFLNTCNQALALKGASTGASIENNVIYQVEAKSDNTSCPAQTMPVTGLEVDSGATSGTTADHNLLFTTADTTSYTWAGTTYHTAQDFNQATGQAAHDINADPQAFGPNEGAFSDASPMIDAADVNAPGELSTDWVGNPRVDDPGVANTGTGAGYYDLGAAEYQDPLAISVAFDTQTGTAPATVTETPSVSTGGWSTPTSWTFDFGDGSPKQTYSTPAVIGHLYTAPGDFTVTVSATDSYGTATTTGQVRILSSSAFHPLSPTRVLDTRKGTGTNGVVAPVAGNGTLPLTIEGASGIPATGVTAVEVNITAVDETAGGYITAYADGVNRPRTSNVNFAAHQTVPNMAVIPVGADGKIDLFNGSAGTTDLVVDVAGYYGQGAGLGLEPLSSPLRILDTRTSSPIPGDGANTGAFFMFGSDQFSAGGAEVLNVTVTGATADGYLTIWPDGSPRPIASNLNFKAHQTIANQVIVPVGTNNAIDIWYSAATGSTNVIVDLTGSFTTAGGAGYVPVNPTRMLDTRSGIGAAAQAVAANGTVNVKLVGVSPLPAQGVSAVAANVTVTKPAVGGYITVFPNYLSTAPKVSTLNFAAGETVSNMTAMSIQADGLKLFNGSGGTSQLVADVYGYYGD
jgi:PKD domain-containing protein/parallel beta helix pectate lyase-like protein